MYKRQLWDGLKNNEIDTVATDHCPFTFKRQKQQGADDFTKCPSGAPGVEERLSLLYSEGVCKGKISMEQLVKYACTNPAKVGGVYPQKGTPVSYTHLDVYKRQFICSTQQIPSCKSVKD